MQLLPYDNTAGSCCLKFVKMGCGLAQLVEQASHLQRFCPRCSRPGFDSLPGASALCHSPSPILFPFHIFSWTINKVLQRPKKTLKKTIIIICKDDVTMSRCLTVNIVICQIGRHRPTLISYFGHWNGLNLCDKRLSEGTKYQIGFFGLEFIWPIIQKPKVFHWHSYEIKKSNNIF